VETNFKKSSKDALITAKLRAALIFDRNIKGSNYNIDTINGKIYIFGIALSKDEKRKVIEEGKGIYGVKKVIPSIILVEDLSRNKS
jgi:osmotically-inducible protein OsmY